MSEATHELNTPLTPLKIQLHMLKAGNFGALNAQQEKAVNVLDRNLDRLRALLSDLLDVARLQNGRLVLRTEPLDLAAVVRDAVETFEAAMRGVGIRLELEAPETLPAVADSHRVTQVVVNFLSNALKFTPPGGSVTIEAGTGAGGGATVRVRDTGLGMTGE
ncbi:MAG: sensor histidine kinase, partial [Thermoplasmatota archaeon]